jgi:KAP family P-loop domain
MLETVVEKNTPEQVKKFLEKSTLNEEQKKLFTTIVTEIKPNANFDATVRIVPLIESLLKNSIEYLETTESDIHEKWESNCFLLDGKWGSGKSWTLEVLERLLKDKGIHHLEYSAWKYLDEKDLFYDLYMGLDTIEDSTLDIVSKKALKSVRFITICIQWFSKFGKISGFVLEQIYNHLDKIALVAGACTANPIIISIASVLYQLKSLDIGEKGDKIIQKILDRNKEIKKKFDKNQEENKKINTMKLFENFTPKLTLELLMIWIVVTRTSFGEL